jgi:hypothetical protein
VGAGGWRIDQGGEEGVWAGGRRSATGPTIDVQRMPQKKEAG